MKSCKGKVHSKSLLNAFYIDFIMLYSASLYYSLWRLLLIHLWHYKIVTILQLPSLSFLNKICCISALKNFSFIVRKAFSSPRKKKNLCLLYSACMLSRFSCVQLFVTSWTTAHQALLSMGFSRQEYWSRLPFLPPGNLPNPGIKPVSLNSPALASSFFTTSVIWEALGPILWYSTAAWRFRNWPFLTCHSLARVFSLKEGKQKNSVF